MKECLGSYAQDRRTSGLLSSAIFTTSGLKKGTCSLLLYGAR
jgi:hypothetical protein